MSIVCSSCAENLAAQTISCGLQGGQLLAHQQIFVYLNRSGLMHQVLLEQSSELRKYSRECVVYKNMLSWQPPHSPCVMLGLKSCIYARNMLLLCTSYMHVWFHRAQALGSIGAELETALAWSATATMPAVAVYVMPVSKTSKCLGPL